MQRALRATLGPGLIVLLAACAVSGPGGDPQGAPPEGTQAAQDAETARGEGAGLSLQVPQALLTVGAGSTGRFTVTLRNDGVETATRLQPPALAAPFRVVADGCTGQPLPSAASCSYVLELQGAVATTGTLPLQVRYDYADALERSAGGVVAYAVTLPGALQRTPTRLIM